MYLDHLRNDTNTMQYSYADVQFAAMDCVESLFKADADLIRYEAQYEVFAKESDNEGFFSKVKEVASKIWEAIKKFFKMIKDFFVGLWKKIRGFFSKSSEDINKMAKEEAKIDAKVSPQQKAEVKAAVKDKVEEMKKEVIAQITQEKGDVKALPAPSGSQPLPPKYIDEKAALEAIDAIFDSQRELDTAFARMAKQAADPNNKNNKVEWNMSNYKEKLNEFLDKKKTEEARERAATHICENLDTITGSEAPIRESVKRLQEVNAKCAKIDERFEKAINDTEKSIKTAEAYMAKAPQGSIVYNQMAAAAKDFKDLLTAIKNTAMAFANMEKRSVEYIKGVANEVFKIKRHIESRSKDFAKAEKKYGKVE